MQPVNSTTVRAVGYDPFSRVMRVEFRSGGIYDYYEINPALFEQMLLPYPWRRIGGIVKGYRYRRVRAA
jgi:hypothetical protein